MMKHNLGRLHLVIMVFLIGSFSAGNALLAKRSKKPPYATFYDQRKQFEEKDPANLEGRVKLAQNLMSAGYPMEAKEQLITVLSMQYDHSEAAKALKVIIDDRDYIPDFAKDLLAYPEELDVNAMDLEFAELTDELTKMYNRMTSSFVLVKSEKYWKWYLDQRTELAKLQRDAYDTIFDQAIYPHVKPRSPGQPIVDTKVNALRKFYTPFAKKYKNMAPVESLPTSDTRTLRKFLEAKIKLYKLCDAMGKMVPEVLETVHALETEILCRYAAGDWDRCISMATNYYLQHEYDFTPLGESIYRVLCLATVQYTQAMGTSMSPAAKTYVKLVNDYRVMFHIIPTAPNERLNVAAFLHSTEMTKLGYFAHESPTPGRRTPQDRVRLEGWGWSAAENISGGGDGHGAFHGFYGSAGHHRNMLRRSHRSCGTGTAGSLTALYSGTHEFTASFVQSHVIRWK